MLCKFSAKFNTLTKILRYNSYFFWTTTNLGKLLITESQLCNFGFLFLRGMDERLRFVACANCTNLGDE